MKKIVTLITLIIMVALLNGCQLATENTIDIESNKDEHIIPYGLKIEMPSKEFVDLTDYLSFGIDCDGEVSQSVTCVHLGQSMSGTIDIKMNDDYVDDELVESSQVIELDVTLYFGQSLQGELIHFKTLSKNTVTEEVIEEYGAPGTNIYGGTSMSFRKEGNFEDGTTITTVFNIDIEVIDDLQSITIKEFDQNNNILSQMMIDQDNLIDTHTVSNETSYIIIEETYIDKDGDMYIERIFVDENHYYDLLFTNNIGLIEQEAISFIFE